VARSLLPGGNAHGWRWLARAGMPPGFSHSTVWRRPHSLGGKTWPFLSKHKIFFKNYFPAFSRPAERSAAKSGLGISHLLAWTCAGGGDRSWRTGDAHLATAAIARQSAGAEDGQDAFGPYIPGVFSLDASVTAFSKQMERQPIRRR
jgi:hypothetical protein